MKWTKTAWFKDVCLSITFLFFFQTILPTAHGLPMPEISWDFGPAAAYAQGPEGFPPVIGVGRTLSAYSVDGIENNQLTITYTVFNRQAEQVDGTLLVSTLEPGVTFQTASPLPDRLGQEMAWGLGSLAPFGSISIQLTVELDDPIPLQLDNGARAYGNLNARAVSASTSPAMLRQDAISGDYLKSTPDANTTDPYVLAKAAELGNDPNRIFEFVRDEIGYESYKGSLRGARGTLWSKAGNALDQASLLIALLRASGIPARYVHGTLSDDLSQDLILSMFPLTFRLAGYIPEGSELSDPANDPQLLEETREHYWVEFDDESGFSAADPTFDVAEIGQSFTTAEGDFDEVPDELRHKVTVRLKAEITGALTGLGGGGADIKVPLNETFNTVELVGKPLSIGHFVNSYSPPAMIFGYTTHTYSPYLIIGQNGSDISDEPIIRGEDYQEFLTNFPLASQFLTGLFLQIDVVNTEGEVETYEHTIVDGMGFAVRQNGGSPAMSVDAEGLPTVDDDSILTVHVLPGLLARSVCEPEKRTLSGLAANGQHLLSGIEDVELSEGDPEIIATLEEGEKLSKGISMRLTRLFGAEFLIRSGLTMGRIENTYLTRAYFSSPRVVLVKQTSGIQADDPPVIRFSIDLMKSDVRALPYPGQQSDEAFFLRFAYGYIDSFIEDRLLSLALDNTDSEELTTQCSSAYNTVVSAIQQGIEPRFLGPQEGVELESLEISLEAKARIAAALQKGFAVFVPTSMVWVNNSLTIAWFEFNPDTGYIVAVNEKGEHQSLTEYVVRYMVAGLTLWVFLREYLKIKGRCDAFGFVKDNLEAIPVEELTVQDINDILKDLDKQIEISENDYKDKKAGFGGDVPPYSEILDTLNKYTDGLKKTRREIKKDIVRKELLPGIFGNPPGSNINSRDVNLKSDISLAGETEGNKIRMDVQANRYKFSGDINLEWQSSSVQTFGSVDNLVIGQATIIDLDASPPQEYQVTSLDLSEPWLLAPISNLQIEPTGSLTYDIGSRGEGGATLYMHAKPQGGIASSGKFEKFSGTVQTEGNEIQITVTNSLLIVEGKKLKNFAIVTEENVQIEGTGKVSPNFADVLLFELQHADIIVIPESGDVHLEILKEGEIHEEHKELGRSNVLDPSFKASGVNARGVITPNTGSDTIQLDGVVQNILLLSEPSSQLISDQNTSISLDATALISTSFSDTYELNVEALEGWRVMVDESGVAIITPAPGLQSGMFPVRLTAQSKTNPDLIAIGTVKVAVTGTQAGITAQIAPDELLTVPLNGAQLPTAFKAVIRNLGPSPDTFELTFPDLPDGFKILNSGTTVTIPAGETAEIGIYLQPVGEIDPPGTPVSFSINVVSTTDPMITASNSEDFTIPDVHGLNLASDPVVLNTTPVNPASTRLILTSVGNVSEDVTLEIDLPEGLTASGLTTPVALDVGESATQTLALTPAGDTPFSSTLVATVTATFGSPENEQTVTSQLRVQVVVPGVLPAANASGAAAKMGRAELANTLNALGGALNNLYQDPSSEIYKSRVLGLLEGLSGQLDDPLIGSFVADINNALDVIAASTPETIEAALDDLGTVLTDFENRLSVLADHNFETALRPNSAVALPETPTQFGLYLKNTGAKTTTYNLTLSGLPDGITGELNETSVTIPPGYAIAPGVTGTNILPIEVYATITQPAHELTTFDFDVTVTVDGAPDITRTAYGSFTAREELVEVVAVTADPAFTDSGGQVNVSARLLNAINQDRSILISYTVKDQEGAEVFTSPSQEAELTVLSSLDTYELGALDTTGFELGSYYIEVTVTELDSQPIPGGMGTGTLLIGSPITAAMSLVPETLPPGDGTVTTTLEVNSLVDYADQGIIPMGLVDTAGEANSVAIYGNYAYVAGTENVTIVDISDLLNPEIVNTFAEGHKDCRIVNNHLVLPYGGGHKISIYSLDDPADPQLLGTTEDGYDYTWPSGAFVQGNTAFEHTIVMGFSGSTIKFVRGDMLAYDIGDPNNPQLLDELYNTSHSSWPQYPGSDYYIGEGAAVNDQIALIPSTTETGTAQNGTGQILIVDISDPSDLFIQGTLEIPGTKVLTGVAIQDNRALVLGNTEGFGIGGPYNTPILTGYYTLTVLDIADPEHPTILNTITTEAKHYSGYSSTGSVVAGTNGFFAVSHLTINDQPVIMLVDASDPANMEVFSALATTRINETLLVGNTLYTVSTSGLGIYDIGGITGTSVTTQVQAPKDTVMSSSFNIEPDEIISGSDYDTLVWHQLFSADQTGQTLTWQSTVTDLQPGEARDITLGATIDFVASGTPGHIELPPLSVACEQILALTPTERTVQPGEEATYTLVVKNPTGSAVTYDFEMQGLQSAWVDLAPSVTVSAQGQVERVLRLQADAFAALGEYGFTVTASADTGARGTVRGALTLEGFPLVDAEAHGIVLTLTPGQPTAGQGTAASFAVRLTNTGNVDESFILSADLPAGLAGSFGQRTVGVPPGLDNYREVLFTVTPEPGTAAGGYPFTLTATSTDEPSVSDHASGTVMVVGNGVDVAISPAAGAPGSTYQLTVTNTGQAQDTFDLVLGGPAGPAATLGTNEVTLAAGTLQVVAITLGEIDFAYEGTLDLTAVATSRGDTAVTDSATAHVIIEATHGITAEFDPADTLELSEPGAVAFLLMVRNTGNTEDAYTAAITGTSGPVAASLKGLDGQPSQSIPIFRLPGLATGAILLSVNLQDYGEGAVTVTVTSQGNSEVNSSDIATLRTGNRTPVADAGPDQSLRIGEPVTLDGRASYDPDEGPSPLTYLWTFADKPDDSALTDADISDATMALASFTPDASGGYLVTLTVLDGELSGSDEVLIQILNNPPVANAGPDQNVETGAAVTLDGSASFDPDGDMITYDWGIEWSLDAKPADSTLTDEGIEGKSRPDPSFTPDVDGLYVFRLIVSDGWSESDPDYVEISATTPNIAPNADAGEDQTAYTGDWVTLDGSGTNDPDSGPEPLSYLWTFKELPAESVLGDQDIFDADQAQASIMPDVAGTYVVNLSVYDGEDSDEDEVTITVSYRNVPPNANAGADQDVTLGDDLILDGSASDDPDYGPESLSFTWTFVSSPDGSTLTNADIFDAGTATPSFTPDVVGSYVLQLEVFDGAESDFDNVMITVVGEFVFKDVSHLLETSTANERSRLDRRSRTVTSTADVTITNVSEINIAVPIHAVFGISAGGVNMPEASGVNEVGDFFYDLEKTGPQKLGPNESVTFDIKFVRPSSVRFTYDITVYGIIP